MTPIADFVRALAGASQAERANVRAALDEIPVPLTPSRKVMSAEERAALGAEEKRDEEAWIAQDTTAAAAIEEQIKRSEAALAEAARLGDTRAVRSRDYSAKRDARRARLWAERPLFVDAWIEGVKAEAHSLRAETKTLPPREDAFRQLPAAHPRSVGEIITASGDPTLCSRVVGNGASVERRRLALFALADDMERWTAKGLFADEPAFNRLFSAAYARVPAVEALESVLKRTA